MQHQIQDRDDVEYVIYARRSSDESSDNQNQSIPSQIEKCIDYAKKEELIIKKKPNNFSMFETESEIIKRNQKADHHAMRIYEQTSDLYIIMESHSAKKPWLRPKRSKLMELVRKWKIKWILSYSPDRQARNMIEWWVIIEYASEEVLSLKYCTFHFNNNASWRMMLWFWFVFSKQYSEKLAEDIDKWNEHAVKAGKSLWDPKYWYIRDEKTGLYQPHPINYKLIKKAFFMKIHENKTNVEIANWLNASWFKKEKKDGSYILANPKNFRRIRQDTFYYWMYIAGKNRVNLLEIGDSEFQPMITEDEYYSLKENNKSIRKPPKDKNKKENESFHPYSTWIVTTPDGYSMTPQVPWKNKRYWHKLEELRETNPNADRWDLFESRQIFCKVSSKKTKFLKHSITYDKIEEAMIELFSHIQVSKSDYETRKDYFKNWLISNRKRIEKENTKVELKINRVKGKRDEFIDSWFGADFSRDEKRRYKKRLKDYEDQIRALRNDIKELDQEEENTIKTAQAFLELLRDAWRLFDNSSYSLKKELTDLVVSNITITAEKAVKITVRDGLKNIFTPKGQVSGGDGSRTRV